MQALFAFQSREKARFPYLAQAFFVFAGRFVRQGLIVFGNFIVKQHK
jgi:hypothetical protein